MEDFSLSGVEALDVHRECVGPTCESVKLNSFVSGGALQRTRKD